MHRPAPLWRASGCALAALALVAALPCPALAQDRRGRSTPGIVLNTGGRHGMCDVLAFTPDGMELLAAGDDKVVHVWDVGGTRIVQPSRILRWPIYREQRGLIFALALSPERGSPRVAVCGHGVKNGQVCIIDRQTGEIELGMKEVPSALVNWAIAWSPDGRFLVHGNEAGQLFRWDVRNRAATSQRFARSGSDSVNRVRLIAFLEPSRFVSVAQDGRVLEWDVRDLEARPRLRGTFRSPRLYRVAISRNGRWLAATGEFSGGNPPAGREPWEDRVELLDLRGLRGGSAEEDCRRLIDMPAPGDRTLKHVARTVALDDTGERLAVGLDEHPRVRNATDNFFRLTGGRVHLFETATGRRLSRTALEVGQRPEALTFRPGRKDQVAVAGGDHHEVRLFNSTTGEELSVVRGAGASPWAVALDATGKYLAWKEQRKERPTSPNDRGSGPWRLLDLKATAIPPTTPRDFRPVLPLDSVDGWNVVPTANTYVWRVVNERLDTDVPLRGDDLYPVAVNQLPMCYTFIPARGRNPVRLVVGHSWGATIYDCRPGKVTLSRVLTGHEGPVTSLAPSRDGRLLVTAGRDQTIAGWSLVDWPDGQRELGAQFGKSPSGRVQVRKVQAGSPAWEMGLVDGDELDVVMISEPTTARGSVYDPGKRFAYSRARGEVSGSFTHQGETMSLRFGVRELCDTDTILARLADTKPRRWHFFGWKDKGQERFENTTVQQRPLWRLFTTRKSVGDHWVIWRWRDFYYDTSSPVADRLLGWHVNAVEVDRKPQFHPLERFRGTDFFTGAKGAQLGFHRPDRVWPFILDAFPNPEKVLFAEIEPPTVQIRVVKPPTPAADLQVRISVRPNSDHPQQRLARVTLWINDFRYDKAPTINKGIVEEVVTIPRALLRQGTSTVTVQCYNVQGGRGQASDTFTYRDPTRKTRGLHALCVGINDYSKARIGGNSPERLRLNCSKPDATELARIFRQHRKSALYETAEVELLTDQQATAQAIKEKIANLGKAVKPDDWFVLFLSGHGFARKARPRTYIPGSFFFLCTDTDEKREETKLTSRQMYDLLAGINCRKLIILDACHSGSVAEVGNPVRDLDREGLERFLILSACRPDQLANEPDPDKVKGKELHGAFTQCLLEALRRSRETDVGKRKKEVTARELGEVIRKHLPRVLDDLNVSSESQTPVFHPPRLPTVPLLCRP